MSMIPDYNVSTLITAAPEPLARLFAASVQRRRVELGLSVERAAELAGMESSEWAAIESGWVPAEDAVLKAVAGALEACFLHISLVAEISLFNQQRIAA